VDMVCSVRDYNRSVETTTEELWIRLTMATTVSTRINAIGKKFDQGST
jgi:hypothetical protein